MDPHAQAIAILQRARDELAARLTQRIIDSEDEIAQDAADGLYVSEIEAIYEQLGGRLAHLNALLSNLPPAPVQAVPESSANEIVYADLACGSNVEVDATHPLTVLALPAPPLADQPAPDPLLEAFSGIVLHAQAGNLTGAARLISEVFDLKPSQSRRGAHAFERQMQRYPDLVRRFEHLGATLHETNEYAAATLLSECFEFQAIDALLMVRWLRQTPLDESQPERGGSSG